MKSEDTIAAPPTRRDILDVVAKANIESAICNTADMAGIACQMLEDAFNVEPDLHRVLTGGQKFCYYIDDDTRDYLMFAVYQTKTMARDLKRDYYAAIDGKA